MRYPNSPSISLFEQLGAGIDVIGQVPVPKVHRYAEDANEGEIAPSEIPAESLDPMQYLPDNMTDMNSRVQRLDDQVKRDYVIESDFLSKKRYNLIKYILNY